jgi:hypothetical protein
MGVIKIKCNFSDASADKRNPDDGEAVLTGLADGPGTGYHVTRRSAAKVRANHRTAAYGGGLSGRD